MKKSEKCLFGMIAGMVYRMILGGFCGLVYLINMFLVIGLTGTRCRKSS